MSKQAFEKTRKPRRGQFSSACKKSNFARAQEFLDLGADINEIGASNWTALIDASYHGNSAAAQFLIAHGAELEGKDSVTGRNAMMWASLNGSTEIVRMLVESGAKLNEKDNSGATALAYVEELISYGKDRKDIELMLIKELLNPALRKPLKVNSPPKLGGSR